MKVVITGGGGFLGLKLARALLARGHVGGAAGAARHQQRRPIDEDLGQVGEDLGGGFGGDDGVAGQFGADEENVQQRPGDAGHQIEARARYWIVPKATRLEFGFAKLLNGEFLDNAPNATGAEPLFGYVEVTQTF